MGLLNHQALQIIKGNGTVPGDTNGIEPEVVTIDLLDVGSSFSLIEWSPNIPSLKAGGVWADSPISDGRVLLTSENTNVIETMRIQLTGANPQAFAANYSMLSRMMQDSRLFWESYYQREIVFLKWWANGAPGAQYATVFNIDMKITLQDSNDSQAEIVLSIEREYGWRGIPPGANPRQWAAYKRNYAFNRATADLSNDPAVIDKDLLVFSTIYNHIQISSNVDVKKNYVDIPAASIPGDLPALGYIQYFPSNNIAEVIVARDTGRKDRPVTGVANEQRYDLSAVEAGSLGTDTTLVNDTGGIIHNAGVAQRGQISFATVATDAVRLSGFRMRQPCNIARFVALARMRQNGGALGEIKCHLLAYGVNTAATVATTEVSPTLQAGAGNTTDWPVTYMGILNLPVTNILNGISGLGYEDNDDFHVDFYARRTAGAGVLYVCDIFLIPIDECAIRSNTLQNSQTLHIFDSTGYFARGKAGLNDIVTAKEADISGQPIWLRPGFSNRLYFYVQLLAKTSQVGYTANIGINIVPRWSGIRDA